MKRLGFHYFPDTNHYRQHDLNIWLPRLKSLGTDWLVLTAPINRSIPENFIHSLIEADIQPVLHFKFQTNHLPTPDELEVLFTAYQHWGIRYVTLFDQPNTHKVWSTAIWSQVDLVENFLDLFLPIANACLNACLTPIFPPLKPGGDYWDTAFLRRALQSLHRRGQQDLLAQLVIGAYSCHGNHPIQWGAGGPERWPNARPYYTPQGAEDQRGFRIFDWYAAISQATLSFINPMFLFGVGYPSDGDENLSRNLTITRLLAGELIQGYESIPKQVIGAAFRPLIDLDEGSHQGWFHKTGEPHPQAEAIIQINKDNSKNNKTAKTDSSNIQHYLLLPSYEWGVSDYHLDIVRPIIKKCQPTIGFSLEEAQNAKRVTVFGGEEAFSEASLNKLRAKGVKVQRIDEDGMNIASLLATK